MFFGNPFRHFDEEDFEDDFFGNNRSRRNRRNDMLVSSQDPMDGFMNHRNMRSMMDPFANMRQMMSADFGNMMGSSHSTSSSMFMGGGAPSSFHSEVRVMSSTTGADGQTRVQNYHKTSRGDGSSQVMESKAAYEDSATGRQVRALERKIGDKGRKVVDERNTLTGDANSHDTLTRMTEAETHDFDRQWESLEPSLPSIRSSQAFRTPQLMSGSSNMRRALPERPTEEFHPSPSAHEQQRRRRGNLRKL